jgi:hypothetical protein
MLSKQTKRLALALTIAAAPAITATAVAQQSSADRMGMEKGTTMVGGQAMFPSTP